MSTDGDTSATTLEQQLARVAGVPSDELLRSWHDAVMDARPAHTAGFGASWLVTLAWAALVAAIAMRSTRWRLG